MRECYLAFAYGTNDDGTFSGLPEYRVRMKDETHEAKRSNKITRNMANRWIVVGALKVQGKQPKKRIHERREWKGRSTCNIHRKNLIL